MADHHVVDGHQIWGSSYEYIQSAVMDG